MKIIIFGANAISQKLVDALEVYEDQVLIVDRDSWDFNNFKKRNAKLISANFFDQGLMESLEIKDTDYVLILTEDDKINLLISRLVRNYTKGFIITKMNSYDDINEIFELKKSLGIDYILNQDLESSRNILKLVEDDIGIKSDVFAGGKVRLIDYSVELDPEFIGKKIHEVGSLSTILVVGILRKNNLIIPSGDTVLEEEDKLYLMGLTDDIISFRSRHFHLTSIEEKKDMIIIGDSGITRSLIDTTKDINIKVIEEDIKKARDLRSRYEDTFVIRNSFKDVLKKSREEFTNCDVLLALTSQDELNIVTCLMADGIGIKDIILKVESQTYNKFLDNLPVSAIINPSMIAADKILKLMKKDGGMNLYHMFADRAEVFEVTLKEGSKVEDLTLKELKLPQGMIIGAVVRKDGSAIIPRGNSKIEKGDRLVIFFKKKNRDNLIQFLNGENKKLFKSLFES